MSYVFLTGPECYRLMVKRQAEAVRDTDPDRNWKLAELGKSLRNQHREVKKYELHRLRK